MQKYWQLFLITWQNGLAYPISVLFWRIRQFLSTLMSLTIWLVIFAGKSTNFGYTEQQMITYIFLVGVLQSMILASSLGDLGNMIYEGRLSYQMIQPLNIFSYLGISEVADKLKNFFFVIIETVILFLLFRPVIVFPALPTFGIFLISTILGIILMFLIMLLFGVVGFWSQDTWGPRFLFYMFLDFAAGKLFPLNIFSPLLQKILYLTPFPYLSYTQTQIFLGKLSQGDALQSLGALIFWIIALAIIFKYLWNKGLREYGAMGH